MKSNTLLRLGVLSALAAAMSGLGGSAAEAVVPPPPFGSVHFPYNDFYAVPQLGTEAVLGSGCGANGTIGETIPDGIWRGRIDSFDLDVVIEATSLQFNLICVFVGETGARERAEWEAANPGDQQYGFPDGFMVDNNPRLRTVPLSVEFVLAGAVQTSTGACAVPSTPGFIGESQPSMYLQADAWLVIENGAAISAITSCSQGGGEMIRGCFGGGLGSHAGWSGDRQRFVRCE
jgi:hypothetical protein